MPALTWDGSSISGRQYSLFRPYAFTDRGLRQRRLHAEPSSAAPHTPRVSSGPLKLPTSDTDLQIALTSLPPRSAASEGPTFAADGAQISRTRRAATADSTQLQHDHLDLHRPARPRPTTGSRRGAKVDLPDLNFPTTRYYWTLVPVLLTVDASGVLKYVDAEVPQDACAAERRASFGKESAPVTTTAGTPYISGLSPQRPAARLGHAQARRLRHAARRLEAREGARAATRSSGRDRSTRGGRPGRRPPSRRRPC